MFAYTQLKYVKIDHEADLREILANRTGFLALCSPKINTSLEIN